LAKLRRFPNPNSSFKPKPNPGAAPNFTSPGASDRRAAAICLISRLKCVAPLNPISALNSPSCSYPPSCHNLSDLPAKLRARRLTIEKSYGTAEFTAFWKWLFEMGMAIQALKVTPHTLFYHRAIKVATLWLSEISMAIQALELTPCTDPPFYS
jgi:hypothetical protein